LWVNHPTAETPVKFSKWPPSDLLPDLVTEHALKLATENLKAWMALTETQPKKIATTRRRSGPRPKNDQLLVC
jgi:hypothetical protein